jgi:tripartite-type tricarboxylate transporter receptor subunit TctC
MLLACHPGLPARDLAQLVSHARAHPGTLAFGTSAFGGAPHLAAELFQAVSGTQLVHVRYDDTRKLYADLEAGKIALSFNNVMSMLPRCQSGVLRGLGLTAAARCPAAPNIPTLAEGGLEGCEVSNWIGLVAPRATETARVQALAMAAAAVLHNRAVTGRLAAAGITACGSTAQEFAALIADERTRWGPIVKRFA